MSYELVERRMNLIVSASVKNVPNCKKYVHSTNLALAQISVPLPSLSAQLTKLYFNCTDLGLHISFPSTLLAAFILGQLSKNRKKTRNPR